MKSLPQRLCCTLTWSEEEGKNVMAACVESKSWCIEIYVCKFILANVH